MAQTVTPRTPPRPRGGRSAACSMPTAGLGVRQRAGLVRPDHPAAGLPARPCLLLHGPADGRHRAARVVADQLLPARERDAALPRAGRRHAPVAHGTRGGPPPGRARGRRGRRARHDVPLRRRHRRLGARQGRVLLAGRRHRQPRQVGRRPERSPRRALTPRPPSSAARSTSSVATAPTASRRDRVQPDPRPRRQRSPTEWTSSTRRPSPSRAPARSPSPSPTASSSWAAPTAPRRRTRSGRRRRTPRRAGRVDRAVAAVPGDRGRDARSTSATWSS